MKAKVTIMSLAVVGVLAATASALAYGPGPGGGPGMGFGPGPGAMMDPVLHAERVQLRLDALQSALKLQPAQLDAWHAYATKVITEAQTRAQLRQGMLEAREDAQAMADQRVTMMKHNAQAADEINQLRKSLYASLSEEQKATFDQYAAGPRFARGPAYGAQPGFGPGYGPRGGRWQSFGRGGCLGMS